MRKSAYWWKTDTAVHPHGDFIPHEAEVVIIGAGVAGISTAYWLFSKRKKSVIVLDNGPFPGYKGAGREFGMMLLTGGALYSSLVESVGAQKARFYLNATKRNNQLLNQFIRKNEVPCNYQPGGLRLAGCQGEMEDFKKNVQLLKQQGHECVLLSEDQIQSIIPSTRLYGGLFLPSEGMIDPFAFVNFVASRLQDTAAVKFYYSAGVKNVLQDGDHRKVILNNGHIVNTKYVVHANGETPPVEFLIPYREHAIATEDLPDNIRETLPIMPCLINGSQDYFRLDDQVLLTAGSRYSSDTNGETYVKNDASYNPKIYQNLSTTMSRLLPTTSIVGHSCTWTMISYQTPDGLPVVGSCPNDPQQLIISGLGSHRFSFGFIAGRMICDLIRGSAGGNGVVSKLISPHRFITQQEK